MINTSVERMPSPSRRSFLRRAGVGFAGLSLASVIGSRVEDQVAYAAQAVNRSSAPSALRITDLRVTVVTGSPFRSPMVRIDTNQGISGYGDVRDGASERYALILKSRLLNQNPCNVEKMFRTIKQFGGQARQGGGVSGIEMALWDLCGKAYGVPVYQLLGGKYRDQIRLYADTDTEAGLDGLKQRIAKGFTWLKMDLGMGLVQRDPGTVIQPAGADSSFGHPFAGITLTDKGCQEMADRFGEARAAAGAIPISSDHFGPISVKSCIRLANALSKYQPAWLEDMIPWQFTDLLREIKTAIDVPLLTGEDIYLLDNFKPLIDTHAVDYVHPDLATAGGILETKKIGDYAEEHGVAMAMHMAGTPLTMMANVHCAAATQNVLAVEHHGIDVAFWEDLVTGIDKPIVNKGYIKVPDTPGLGVEPNPDVVKLHMERGQEYFGPTDEWNTGRSNDRLWS